jgi:hypothetical protein
MGSAGAGRGSVHCINNTATKKITFLVLKTLIAMLGAADCTRAPAVPLPDFNSIAEGG